MQTAGSEPQNQSSAILQTTSGLENVKTSPSNEILPESIVIGKILDTSLLKNKIDSEEEVGGNLEITETVIQSDILDFDKIKTGIQPDTQEQDENSELNINGILDINELLGVNITDLSPHEIPNSTTIINVFSTPNSTSTPTLQNNIKTNSTSSSLPKLNNSTTTSNNITKSSNSPIITILAASCSVFTALVLLCLLFIT